MKNINTYSLRIKPKEKLLDGVAKFCQEKKIKSAVIVSMLGSVRKIELGFLKKLPGRFKTQKFEGPLEIVTGTGTVATKNNETIIHIHLQISNEKSSVGGHLIEAEIFSTCEIIIGEFDEEIERYHDPHTGLNELKS